MSEQRPSVGRMVHYTSHGSADGVYGKACRAAMVTAVDETTGRLDLLVANPTGIHFPHGVNGEHIDDKIEPGPSGRTGGTWHWPERV